MGDKKINTNKSQSYIKRILSKKNIMILFGIIALYILLSVLVEQDILSRQYKSLIVPLGANIILAVSLNLVAGFLGELSLGHAGFMALGAFSGAIFTLNVELPGVLEFILAILIGGIVAGIFGLLVGVPVLRLRGDYLAIVTLAFGEIVRSVINAIHLPSGTDEAGNTIFRKGTMGLSGIETYSNYRWIFIATVLTIILCVNLVNSRHGRVITSIRDNDIAAESIGIKVGRYKTMAFVIGAFFAGVAGVLNGHNFTFMKPSDYSYDRSIDILVFVVLGGMGNIKGSIIAAIVLTLLPEVLRPIQEYRMLMYSVLLIAMMIFNNSDLKKKLQEHSKLSKLFGRKSPEEE